MSIKKLTFKNKFVNKLLNECELTETTSIEDTDKALLFKRGVSDLPHLSIDNLHKFAREGNVEQLTILIKQFKRTITKCVNCLDVEKMSPLHYAARFNHLECVRILVERSDANVNVTNEEKATPIHFAARYRRKAQNKDAGQKTETIDIPMSENVSPEIQERLIEEEKRPTKDNSVILYLVSKGANPNFQDSYGCTALHYAAMQGNEVAAEQLLMISEIDPEIRDNESMTPLHLACSYGQFEIAKMILQKSTKLFNCEETGCIPFHTACGIGHTSLVNLLISIAEGKGQLAKILNAVDRDHKTPLHYAVQNGHIEVSSICLEKGADANSVTNTGRSSLHFASHCGSVELVKLLISFGGSLKVTDKVMQTPMHLAAQNNHVSVIEYLIEQGAEIESRDLDSCTPVLLAASNGHCEALKMLMEHQCDIHSTEKGNKSSLYLAVVHNYPEVVKVILTNDQGNKLLHIPDCKNNYPLHIACKDGNEKIVKILLDAGAIDDSKDEDERTPMHLAAKFGRTHIVKILGELLKRSLINDQDEDSNTPLHLAAKSGYPKVIQLLLNFGADKNARNCSRYSALDYAAAKGNWKAAQVLLQNGAEVDSMDKSKITPLYLACKNGHDALVTLLLRHHADVSIRVTGDSNDPATGCNPLDAAIDNGHRDCALAILKSGNWEVAMRNQTKTLKGDVDTPMRKMIRKMPDVAEELFRKCKVSNDKHPDHVDYSITYNFEFLEDSYASWCPVDLIEKERIGIELDTESESTICTLDVIEPVTYNQNEKLSETAKLYNPDRKIIMRNHPLMVMVTNRREDLLDHHIVSNLLKLKWINYGIWFYYINLTLYIFYLLSLLSYMMELEAPYQYYLKNKSIGLNGSTCFKVKQLYPKSTLKHRSLACKYVVTILVVLGLLKESSQLIINRLNYFSLENIMECIMYILSFVTVVDISPCQLHYGIREPWQWQTGALASFMAIMNLVLFIRKVPFFGIFVVMFTDVFSTFIRFLPLFLLFIFAFAFTFYILLCNQPTFFNLLNSIMQTTVMTIGELEFDTIFNSQWNKEPEDDRLVFYDAVTYAVFVIFILIMNIITMNLLVGLAVDDIKAVQEKATLERMGMQVTLVLEVEGFIPEFIRRRYITRKVTVYPNRKTSYFKSQFSLGKEVRHQIIKDDQLDDGELIKKQLSSNAEQIAEMKHKIRSINSQTQLITKMLTKIIKNFEINFEDEDIQEDDEF